MLDDKLVVGVVSWLAGILSSAIVTAFNNRRTVLSYFVHHARVATAAEDRMFGNVQILWNGAAVPNIYLSTVDIINESARDLQNVRLKAFTNDTVLLNEFPQLVGTTEVLKFAPDFQALLEVRAGEQPTPQQWEARGARREYVLPVLNRGQAIKLQYLNVSKSEKQPTIWLEAIHPGVVVRFRPPHPQVFGVAAPVAGTAGLLIGLLFAALMYVYSSYLWLTAFGCMLFGLFAQLPGAYTVRAIRQVRRWFTG